MDINAVVAANSGSSRVESVQSTSVTQDASARAGDEVREPPADRTHNSPEEER